MDHSCFPPQICHPLAPSAQISTLSIAYGERGGDIAIATFPSTFPARIPHLYLSGFYYLSYNLIMFNSVINS